MSESSAELTILGLVVDLIGHLAWPLVVLAVAILFAPTLRRMAERLSSLEAPGVKLSLSDRVRDAAEAARHSDLTVIAPPDTLRLPSPTMARSGGWTPPPPPTRRPTPQEIADGATIFAPPPLPPDVAAQLGLTVVPAPEAGSEQGPSASPPPAPSRDADGGELTIWIFDGDRAPAGKTRSATDQALGYVVDTMGKIESQMREIAAADGLPWSEGLEAAVARLRGNGVLDSRLFTLYETLRGIRSDALRAGAATLSEKEAKEWAGLCLTLTQRLDQRARMKGVIPRDPPVG